MKRAVELARAARERAIGQGDAATVTAAEVGIRTAQAEENRWFGARAESIETSEAIAALAELGKQQRSNR